MKKIHFLIALVCFGFSVNAQINLVPNGSFEILDSCQDYFYGVPVLPGAYSNPQQGWYAGGKYSVDFFASCILAPKPNKPLWSAPLNCFGYQNPQHGQNYGGFLNYHAYSNSPNPNWNITETFGTNLSDSLIIGQKYYFSMWVSLADSFNCASNMIGMRLSSKKVYYTSPFTYNTNTATLYFINVITDMQNWTQLKGSFVADSNYKGIYIGNFYECQNTDTSIINNQPFPYWANIPSNPNKCLSYYYLDNIKLSTDSSFVSTDIIENKKISNEVILFPNPTSNFVNIKSSRNIYSVEIYDLLGNILTTKNNDNNIIDISDLSNGIYFLKMIDKNNHQIINKIIKTQ